MNRIRRTFAVVVLGAATGSFAAPLPGGTLNPLSIPKYVDPLVIPPRMPNKIDPATGSAVPNAYDIAVRQFPQQVLPAPLPATTVWGYGAVDAPGSFNYPGYTFETSQGTPTTVTWRNELVDASRNFLPHLLPVDQTLHWANPVMACIDGSMMTDCRGFDPTPYGGPVPIITHLHGAHVDPVSDGYPEAWYLPDAANIPFGFATQGSNYGTALPAAPGQAVFVYRNDQRATTLWYHDHTLGMTRTNVYAGLAGFYLHRDAYEASLNLPGPYGAYELPIVIQDRSFNADGSLFYPASRAFFDGFAGPYIPTPGSDVSPLWNPEFFGNTMVVNGKTWPKLSVEPRKYRLRLLNGSDSRAIVLEFATARLKPARPPIPFIVIGNDGGLLTGAPVPVQQLVIGPGERYDAIVDFTGLTAGTRVILTNIGPDAPFGGSVNPGQASDPTTTGQVMAFDVVPLTAPDTSSLPVSLAPPPDPFGTPAPVAAGFRALTLTEFMSMIAPGPSHAQLGDAWGPLPWMAPITENPAAGTTEEWGIVNTTADAHPIHLHQVQFKVVSRVQLDMKKYNSALAACPRPGAMVMGGMAAPTPPAACPPDPRLYVKRGAVAAPPAPWEGGQKDTILSNPGELTTVRALFDIPGLYVWHCHILSHEDNEMMRPFCVTDAANPSCVQ
jgi:FtsP/CotA-like multicopper oxidase with cupredoxin domain